MSDISIVPQPILNVFPKPIPPLDLETEADETGFTMLEKLLERFRGIDGNFQLESLTRHPRTMLQIYGRLIEEGLDNLAAINLIMLEVVEAHSKHDISAEDITKMTKCMNEHLQFAMQKVCSPTLVLALDKIGEIVNEYHSMEFPIENKAGTETQAEEEEEEQIHVELETEIYIYTDVQSSEGVELRQ